jgi:hypothetical protein
MVRVLEYSVRWSILNGSCELSDSYELNVSFLLRSVASGSDHWQVYYSKWESRWCPSYTIVAGS